MKRLKIIRHLSFSRVSRKVVFSSFVVLSVTLFLNGGSAEMIETKSDTTLLDECFRKLHLDRDALDQSPEGYPSYFTLARNTIVDDILKNPRYMPAFVQVYGAKMNGETGPVAPAELFHIATEIGGGSNKDNLPEVPERHHLIVLFEDINLEFGHAPLTPGTRKYLEDQIHHLPSGLEDAMITLCEAFVVAVRCERRALAMLTDSERRFLMSDPVGFVVQTGGGIRETSGKTFHENQKKLLHVMRKVDLNWMCIGMEILLQAVEITRPRLMHVHDILEAERNQEILLRYDSPLGAIIIGGPGINRYDDDAALIVDLDGSDAYNNNAGGSWPVPGGVACVVDLGGNDIYSAERIGFQGSGILGIGILVDYSGDDHYFCQDFGQGSAFGGAGFLYDETGNDTYSGGALVQGAAVFGIGIAADIDGVDFFACDGLGQGFGSTIGIGVLLNIAGNDNYFAGNSSKADDRRISGFAQGAGMGFLAKRGLQNIGLWGGIGMLIDRQGDDNYYGSEFVQGSSETLAMGALLDSNGNDVFDSHTHSQGFGKRFGAGILIDQFGDDRYSCDANGLGAAQEAGIGFHLDYHGNDRYIEPVKMGLGATGSPGGFGMHIDYEGNDEYHAGTSALGFVKGNREKNGVSTAIFIDHRGSDHYIGTSLPDDIADNSEWMHSPGGIGLDTPDPPTMYFRDQQGTSQLGLYSMSPVYHLENCGENSMSFLGASDVFSRFHAPACLPEFSPDTLKKIVEVFDVGHDEYRKNLEEIVFLGFLNHEDHIRIFADVVSPLAHSFNPETRRFYAQLAGWFKLPGSTQKLRDLSFDRTPEVRYTVNWALHRLKDKRRSGILGKARR